MSRFAGLIRTVDDHANPVVVKELRQAVQNRMVIAVLLLSLLINVIITSSFLALSSEIQSGRPAGTNLYQTLYALLVGTCMIFVPLYAALRMTFERNNTNIDLLFITTIPPSSIVRGKFWAAVALTALIYSACLPFLSFTYLLRGIDLPSIFVSLGFSFLCTLLSIMAAIFVGSVSGGLFLRVFLALGLLYFGAIMMGMTVAMGMLIVNGGLGSFFASSEAWIAVSLSLLLGTAGLILFYLLSVASISAKTSNRMFPIRVFATICWLLSGIGVVVWSFSVAEAFPLLAWLVSSCVFLSIIMGLLPCERENWTPRVRRTIPRRWLPRFVSWLFYTGSAGGMVWCLLLAFGTLGTSLLYQNNYPSHFHRETFYDTFIPMTLLLLFTWCYTMSGVLLRRWLAPRSSPVLATVLGVILLGLGGSIPLFIAYTVMGMTASVDRLPLVFVIANPFVMLDSSVDRGSVMAFLMIWSVIMLVLNQSWFRSQWNAFQRYLPSGPAEASVPPVIAEAPGVAGS